MPSDVVDDAASARRSRILLAARWCFLNFGFAKTSFEDIAQRADLSRTLLYRVFADKQSIFKAVFVDWLVSRHPAARAATTAAGTVLDRLLAVSRLMVVEPWSEMVGAPMASAFFESCERLDPETSAEHRRLLQAAVAKILGDARSAEVYLLALDGLLADEPAAEVLAQRTELLAARFAAMAKPKRARR